MDNTRYDGRPLLRFVECYVLRVIGELPTKDERHMQEAEHILQETFSSKDKWYDIIKDEIRISATDDDEIKKMWFDHKKLTQYHKQVLTSEEFARIIVDQNFPIDPV